MYSESNYLGEVCLTTFDTVLNASNDICGGTSGNFFREITQRAIHIKRGIFVNEIRVIRGIVSILIDRQDVIYHYFCIHIRRIEIYKRKED